MLHTNLEYYIQELLDTHRKKNLQFQKCTFNKTAVESYFTERRVLVRMVWLGGRSRGSVGRVKILGVMLGCKLLCSSSTNGNKH